MKRALLLLAVLGIASSAVAQTASIKDVAWLQGCWEQRDGDRVVEERWMPPRAGGMIGVGRTTRGEKLIEHEYIVLTERDGRLAYEAHPSGQATATFMSRPMAGHEVVFEDPTHDFPQRVHYKRTATGLDAEISLADGKKPVRWNYRRTGSVTKD